MEGNTCLARVNFMPHYKPSAGGGHGQVVGLQVNYALGHKKTGEKSRLFEVRLSP